MMTGEKDVGLAESRSVLRACMCCLFAGADVI